MFAPSRRRPERLEIADRIKQWTRKRFSLPADSAILVAELACALPGCPPLETVISFWDAGERRYHFKIFKPLAEIREEDLPYAWLLESLAVPEDFQCDCC